MKFLVATFSFVILVNSLFATPAVTGVNPHSGSVTGGNSVAISGSGFTGAVSVKFGSKSSVFIQNSDTTITATAPAGTPGTVDITVTTGSGTSPISPSDRYTYQGAWIAYVTDRLTPGTVTPVDLSTNLSGVPFSSGGNFPIGLAITPDGTRAVVTNYNSDDVSIIDLSNMSIITTIPTGTNPIYVGITPDGTKAVVANNGSSDTTVIDLTTNTVLVPSIAIGVFPNDLAITPDGKFAYIVSQGTNSVDVVDLTTFTVVGSPIFIGANVNNIAITPDGKFAYVTVGTTHKVSIIDTTTNSVVGPSIDTGGIFPTDIAISADGTIAAVSNFFSNTVILIDLTTNTVIGSPIPVGSRPNGIAITPDSKLAYVVNSASNSVSEIDLASHTKIADIATGFTSPIEIAIAPDQAPVASFTVTVANVSSPSSFDASSSLSPVGTVVKYDWDFGDGVTTSTTSPMITHTYTQAGNFTVVLTVTNSGNTSLAETFTGKTMSNDGSSLATTSSVITIQAAGGSLRPPQKFHGKLHRRDNKHKLKIKLTWVASPSANIAYYELYEHNELIKKLSSKTRETFKKLHRSAQILFHKHKFKKYRLFLHNKYKLRAVNSAGLKSPFVHLKVKSWPKENKDQR